MGGQFSKGSFSGKSSCINWDIRHPKGFIFISIEKLPSYQDLIQRRDVITISEAKHTKVLAIEKDLKRHNTKMLVTTPKRIVKILNKKMKDISNRDKETYI